jgi:hypothetical protein
MKRVHDIRRHEPGEQQRGLAHQQHPRRCPQHVTRDVDEGGVQGVVVQHRPQGEHCWIEPIGRHSVQHSQWSLDCSKLAVEVAQVLDVAPPRVHIVTFAKHPRALRDLVDLGRRCFTQRAECGAGAIGRVLCPLVAI